jgi:DNA-binding NtrC family response regulator
MSIEQARLKELQRKYGILGESRDVLSMLETIEQVAPTDISVLIAGESGTGKDLVASALHKHSRRAHRPLVVVNCGAIPAGIIESELFGHKKGAFTGANEDRKGYFQTADGGTIFLDEIGETPLETQVKLLRVLEQGEFLPVGSSKPVRVDVRIIAASNRNLAKEVDDGSFRQDLYYRLKAIMLTVPPLRDRQSDIGILADKFARECALRNDILFKGFSEGAVQAMRNYRWPGNVRELKNFVESIVVLEKGGVIKTETLIRYLNQSTGGSPGSTNPLLPVKLDRSVDQAERELIIQQLFLLRREISEMKELMHAGLTVNPVLDSDDPAYPSHMEIIPDEYTGEDGEEDETSALNDAALGSVTAADVEKELIYRTLLKFRFNKRKTAQVLEMAERTLYRKIKEYDIQKP